MKPKHWLSTLLLTGFLSIGLFLYAGRQNHCSSVQLKLRQCPGKEVVVSGGEEMEAPVIPSVILF